MQPHRRLSSARRYHRWEAHGKRRPRHDHHQAVQPPRTRRGGQGAAATSGGIPDHGTVVRPSRNVLRATPSPTATCRRGGPAANAAVATSSGSARSRRERCFTPAHRATTRHRPVATTRHLG
jgi:hypothetical protein